MLLPAQPGACRAYGICTPRSSACIAQFWWQCFLAAVQANSARLSAPCTALPTAVLASGWPAVAFDRVCSVLSVIIRLLAGYESLLYFDSCVSAFIASFWMDDAHRVQQVLVVHGMHVCSGSTGCPLQQVGNQYHSSVC